MLELGLVGKPNTGKTTFFNASTLADAPMGGYPFTTIDANIGVTYVRSDCPCQELDLECDPNNSRCENGTRYVPVRVIDVAGLVEGAYEGKGLGNQFLDNLRMASVLIHLIDTAGATDAEGEPVSPGEHDPLEDVGFLEKEFDLWLTEILSDGWERFVRKIQLEKGDISKALTERVSGLGIKQQHVSSALRKADINPEKADDWGENELFELSQNLREESKPIILGANKVDVKEAKENYERLKELDYPVIPMSCESELALRRAAEKDLINYKPGDSDFEILKEEGLSEDQRKALSSVKDFLEEWGTTGVQDAIDKAIYDLLEMIVVYPVDDEHKFTDKKGNVLPDAHLVPEGTTAKEFAYEIHSDLGESFLHAIDAKTERRVGEDYELENGDIIRIVSTEGR